MLCKWIWFVPTALFRICTCMYRYIVHFVTIHLLSYLQLHLKLVVPQNKDSIRNGACHHYRKILLTLKILFCLSQASLLIQYQFCGCAANVFTGKAVKPIIKPTPLYTYETYFIYVFNAYYNTIFL